MTTATQKKTVLLIDDDADFVASVSSVLEAEGYTVLEAQSGQEGLERLVERPDVVVLDIMMETSTEGYSVSEAIQVSEEFGPYHDIPIIMVSSIRESPDELFPRAPEVDVIRPRRYLTKPLDIPAFLQAIRDMAGG